MDSSNLGPQLRIKRLDNGFFMVEKYVRIRIADTVQTELEMILLRAVVKLVDGGKVEPLACMQNSRYYVN